MYQLSSAIHFPFLRFRALTYVHSILFYSIRLPGFDGHEKKERLAVLRVI